MGPTDVQATVAARRREMVRRLLAAEVSPTVLMALLPGWEGVIRELVDSAAAGSPTRRRQG